MMSYSNLSWSISSINLASYYESAWIACSIALILSELNDSLAVT